MIGLTMKHLRYFEALARIGHFGRAAESCAISQPALSMQIKELEEELGNNLFERSARDVKLTAFGPDSAAYTLASTATPAVTTASVTLSAYYAD